MADDVTRAFAARVRARREALGWSQRELARRAGILPSTACRAEQGREVWLSAAAAMAAALGVPLGDLASTHCGRCHGAPPTGYQCRECGAIGEAAA